MNPPCMKEVFLFYSLPTLIEMTQTEPYNRHEGRIYSLQDCCITLHQF